MIDPDIRVPQLLRRVGELEKRFEKLVETVIKQQLLLKALGAHIGLEPDEEEMKDAH